MIFNPGDLARDKETGEIVEVVEEEFREHPFELLYVVRGVTGKVCYFVKPTNMESISALEALGDQVDSRD